MNGTTIFSHIIPIILGFLGVLLISSGIMDEKRTQLIEGVILFILACILPFLILRLFL